MTQKRDRSALEQKLGFRIVVRKSPEAPEQQVGSLIWTEEDGTTKAVRPCTVAEIQMWETLEEFGATASGIVDAHKSLNPFGTKKEEG